MSESARTYEDLIVWRKAHELVLGVYEVTATFPKEEVFGLTSQVRRSAISVPSNIVEGFNRKGKSDKLKFYNYSDASLEEMRYQLQLSQDLGFADTSTLQEKAKEVRRILSSYTEKLKASS